MSLPTPKEAAVRRSILDGERIAKTLDAVAELLVSGQPGITGWIDLDCVRRDDVEVIRAALTSAGWEVCDRVTGWGISARAPETKP